MGMDEFDQFSERLGYIPVRCPHDLTLVALLTNGKDWKIHCPTCGFEVTLEEMIIHGQVRGLDPGGQSIN
jgi:hypothetical protein